MKDLGAFLHDLVVANRILAHEGVVDGYGHVSIRHPNRPDRFFLSCSRSPALVTLEDIMEYDLDSKPVLPDNRLMYVERPIHGGIYQARPDVLAVVHNHAYEVIPFSITKAKLRPILHVAGGIGADIPVWDIRDKFGDTNMLVTTTEQGQDLARCLGLGHVALMRGHGSVVASASLQEAVLLAINLKVNAKLQAEAMRLGEITYLSDGEIAQTEEMVRRPESLLRVWEYWTRRSEAHDL